MLLSITSVNVLLLKTPILLTEIVFSSIVFIREASEIPPTSTPIAELIVLLIILSSGEK